MTQIIQTYIDMGSSATKCLYWQGQPYLLHLAPQVARLNPARLDRLMLGGLTSQEPEDSAYVMVGNSAYAIGALAIAQKGDSGLALPKRDRAVYKILATLGVIAEKTLAAQDSDSTGCKFTAQLGLLLPLEEYWQDRKELKAQILGAISDFSFRGRALFGQLERIEMQPEGAGLYLAKGLQLARAGVGIRDSTVVVLMFGHRNLSILTFEKGSTPQETNSTSQGPGFVEYLKQCATELPGVAPDDPALLEAVLQGHPTFHVPGRKEALDLAKACSYAREFYLDRVNQFLVEWLPSAEVEVIVGGGAAYFIRPELEQFFDQRGLTQQITWAEALRQEMTDVLRGQEGTAEPDLITSVRWADVYGLFKTFMYSANPTQTR
ncbi:ParM/StbA family protein [Leptolyngbya sp. CCNP1308]|uniref:ParM/StbA family protein n=1 Tax=Leptolyngbya sp. CCNP1308 TaxID=3110255 RepID=UPI002B20AC62|nr:ParM/StbA family protein [Leptolyngbya sp. CCNP1308]MEA5452583.1 ParM/StbA family protein [Leptolyngbya sp. CCNP1308]